LLIFVQMATVPRIIVRAAAPTPPGDAALIVLSPHFDDAVLSCGGCIAAAVAAGRQVVVVTVFAGTPLPDAVPPRLRRFADYGARRAEDDRALAVLGATAERLDFVERAFRAPPLRSPGALFRVNPSDLTNRAAMREAVRGLLHRHPDSVLLCPLGIGNHVDHVDLFLAALAIRLSDTQGDRIWFYEDPYALLPAARQRYFLTRHLPAPGANSLAQPGLRARLLDRLLGWATCGLSWKSLLPSAALSLDWSVMPVRIAAHEDRKLAAVRAYTSQLAVFGGTSWLKELRRQHSLFDGAELLWHATRPAAKVVSAVDLLRS